jgi:adenosylcobyric acid synthase
LGLLPVETVMAPAKTTRAVTATLPKGIRFRAYEIHLGQTKAVSPVEPFAWVEGQPEGARARNAVGTYLHGALEDYRVLSDLLGRPVAPPREKEADYDALARWFATNADVKRFEEAYL